MSSLGRLAKKPWIWSWIAAFVVWFATIMVTGGASTLGLSQAALTFAAFSIIVGIGQMFVITLGPGNIDLSVPATMTLAGTVALKLMNVDNSMVLPGLLVAVLIGVRWESATTSSDQGVCAFRRSHFRTLSDELHKRAAARRLTNRRFAHQAAGRPGGLPPTSTPLRPKCRAGGVGLSLIAWVAFWRSRSMAAWISAIRPEAGGSARMAAFRSMARASSPICLVRGACVPSPATCLPASSAARHSNMGAGIF